jgi:Bbp16-like protein
MGYVDAQNLYSDAQALTVTAVSTNVIDHGQDRNIGIGTPLGIVITVDVSAAGGGTLTVTLQADDNVAMSSPATVATTAAIAAATLVAGYQFVIPVPPDTLTERFSRLNYTLATMTGITLTAYMAPIDQIQNAPMYAAGVTVQ